MLARKGGCSPFRQQREEVRWSGESKMVSGCSPLKSRDTEGLSAYERERNKNVQQNRQVPSP